MKSAILKIQVLLVLFLLMNSGFVMLEGRPLSITGTGNSATGGEVVELFDWLSHSLGAIKQANNNLGGIKESGPSGPGVGHKFNNANTLGGIKNSGPSSGGPGHKFTNSETLGGIKNSGQGH